MKRFILLFWAALLMPLNSLAVPQDEVQSTKDKIFDIKLDARYLKEELQDEDEYNAREYAFQELLKSVNVGRKEKGQDSLLEKQLRPQVQFLSYKRSSAFKALAFVLIADVDKLKSGIPFGKYFEASQVASPLTNQDDPGRMPGSTVEIPKIDPVVNMPPETPTVVNSIASSSSVARNQVLMSLTTMEWAPEIKESLEEFKKENRISEFDKAKKGESFRDDDYLIFFDQQLVMQAILQPLGGGKYKNFQTKMEETLDNYRGKGFAVLWFRF